MIAADILREKNYITQKETLSEFLKNVHEQDEKISELYSKYTEKILEKTSMIQICIDKAVKWNEYDDCLRGIFGAVVLDINYWETTGGGYKFNRPSPEMLKICRFEEDKCTRMLGDPKHGSDYGACPSVHARERVHVPGR